MLSRLLSLMMVFMSLGQATLNAYVEETNLGGLLYLVNRQYPLTRQFVPQDLVKPDVLSAYGDITLRAEAASALEALFGAAKAEGAFQLMAVSAYRSYDRQRAVYARKISSTGSEKKAGLLVAPPGSSEHQLGLAADIGRKSSRNLNLSFGSSPEGQWLAGNAHRFGFIIRYKAEWTAVTGYSYEPWHIRYVGKDHAQRLYDLDIPLESYIEQLLLFNFGDLLAEDAS